MLKVIERRINNSVVERGRFWGYRLNTCLFYLIKQFDGVYFDRNFKLSQTQNLVSPDIILLV